MVQSCSLSCTCVLVEGGAPSRFVSVLDKRRQENKQQDGNVTEDKDVELDEDEESITAQKEPDQGLSIFRYKYL